MICAACGRRMVSNWTWRHQTPAERAAAKAAGLTHHLARGLCGGCYTTHTRDRDDFERKSVPGELIADEWAHADLPRDWSKAKRIRHLAPRLGVTESALERALLRAGIPA